MIENGWTEFLKKEKEKEYFQKLWAFVSEAYTRTTVYPPKDKIFSAFMTVDYPDVKVVILGQDPYHQFGQAHGMCFSVNKGVKVPPSLVNIYKELHSDLGCTIPSHGYLMDWAKQGVFLLNTILTVEDSKPLAHKNKGWEIFTDNVIEKLNEHETPIVFILWGANARSKASKINTNKHLVLEAPHPSPLSAYNGFFGSKPFSQCNAFLIKNHRTPIHWQIEE